MHPLCLCPIVAAFFGVVFAQQPAAVVVDKSKAVGPCIDGICPPKHFCYTDNECYPKERRTSSSSRRMRRQIPDSIGPCVNGLCPNGYDCVKNVCLKSKNWSMPSDSPKSGSHTSIGPCVNAKCPDGYACNKEEYKCYAKN